MSDNIPAPTPAPGGPTFQVPQGTPAPAGAPAGPITGGGKADKPGKVGLIALICAIAGTIFAAWEGAYIIGWVLLPIAFILAIVGIAMNSRRKLAIGALILSIVGTVVGVVSFADSLGNAVDEAFSSASIPAAGTVATPAGGEAAPSENSSEEAADEGKASFKDGVYQADGVTITIKGTRVIPVGQAGNAYGSKPLLVVDYTITNNSATREVTPAEFWLVFAAYQDNDPNSVNKLEFGTPEDLYETYGDIGSQAIKVGGSVDYAEGFQLDDTTTPVELVASTILGGEIGRQTINLQ